MLDCLIEEQLHWNSQYNITYALTASSKTKIATTLIYLIQIIVKRFTLREKSLDFHFFGNHDAVKEQVILYWFFFSKFKSFFKVIFSDLWLISSCWQQLQKVQKVLEIKYSNTPGTCEQRLLLYRKVDLDSGH